MDEGAVERLTTFYTTYNPSALSKVEETIAKYAGKLDTLWAALDKKYAKEIKTKKAADEKAKKASEAAAEHAGNVERLTAFYTSTNPEKANIASVEKVLAQYKGKVAKLWEALSKKYPDATV